MASLNCRTRVTDGVTLVELVVAVEEPTRVRVVNRLDGPVWPPRTEGVPAAGWEKGGFDGTVTDRRVLGYASPAEPLDPPARIESARPVTPEDGDDVAPRALVRSLGTARPPRAAVADEAGGSAEFDRTDESDRAIETESSVEAVKGATREYGQPPPAIDAWLDAVESRIEAAERLASADSLAGAREAVDDVGGIRAVETLRERLIADRRSLDRIGNRIAQFESRATNVEIPVETLDRVR